MTLERLGLRARLALAMAGTAVVATALSTAFAERSVDSALRHGGVAAVHHSLLDAGLEVAVIAIVLALTSAALLAVTLARPLRRLTAAADRIASGGQTAHARGGGREIEQLGGALARLDQTLRSEQDLRRAAAADLAHELRAPMAGIVARIEAAQDGVFADGHANLEAARKDALRMARLIDDLDHVGGASVAQPLHHMRPLDLAAVAAGRVGCHAAAFEAAGIDFVARLEAAPVVGDEHRLEQIIDNLLSNALRYTDAGGTVVLNVRPVGPLALLEVCDTGIGIAPDDQPYVFDRFWRADTSPARAVGGSGVGLAVVRELVVAHDGEVSLDSVAGAGTTFSVAIPGPKLTAVTARSATIAACPPQPSSSIA